MSPETSQSLLIVGQPFKVAQIILYNNAAKPVELQVIGETSTTKRYDYELREKSLLAVFVDKSTAQITELRFCVEATPSKGFPRPKWSSVDTVDCSAPEAARGSEADLDDGQEEGSEGD